MAKKKAQPTAAPAARPSKTEESYGLQAQVNEKTRHGTVIAFSGVEYVRYEWRAVPAGFEEQARAHPYLTVRGRIASDDVPDAPAVVEEPAIVMGGAPAVPPVTDDAPADEIPADDE